LKRSELNDIVDYTINVTENYKFPLPPFAYYKLKDWQSIGENQREIVDNMLGWDVTDFGTGDFDHIGLTIFTFRNGNFQKKEKYPKPYAEKLLFVKDGQILPFHFHWSKMEDIINRGGGILKIKIYNSDEKEEFCNSPVTVGVDGSELVVEAGSELFLEPGQSITLRPGQYHQWQGVPGSGDIVLFEVSTTNDDRIDNRFYQAKSRLPEIDEDIEAKYLLFTDYDRYIHL